MQQLMSWDELQTVMLDFLDVQSEVQGEEDNRESEFSSNNESDWSED